MPRGLKRTMNVDLEERVTTSGHLTDATSIAAFPDEMLVAIFVNLDSVTRKVAERVCPRWLALLRQTLSLQKYIKIDLSILPTFATADPSIFNAYNEASPKYHRLYETVKRLVQSNTIVETLHITDENNPEQPWMSTVALQTRDERRFDDGVLGVLGPCLVRVVRSGEEFLGEFPPRLSRVIFTKLSISVSHMTNTRFFGAGSLGGPPALQSIELRDVKVYKLCMNQLWSVYERNRDWKAEITRAVSSAIIVYNHPTCAVDPFVQFLNAVGENDGPLTAEEEERLRMVVEMDLERLEYRLENMCRRIVGKKVSVAEIIDRSTLTPFQKRLLAGVGGILI